MFTRPDLQTVFGVFYLNNVNTEKLHTVQCILFFGLVQSLNAKVWEQFTLAKHCKKAAFAPCISNWPFEQNFFRLEFKTYKKFDAPAKAEQNSNIVWQLDCSKSMASGVKQFSTVSCRSIRFRFIYFYLFNQNQISLSIYLSLFVRAIEQWGRPQLLAQKRRRSVAIMSIA